MCESDSYQVDLSSLNEGVHHREFYLDDAYFEQVDSDAVRGGLVSVALEIHRAGCVFTLAFHVKGEVTVACDLCLDDMQLPVDTNSSLTVKLGQAEDVDDDSIVLDESDGVLDLSWLMYEQVVLAMPIRHVHAPGHCNAEMSQKLEELSSIANRGGRSGEDAIDQRWEKLKHLKIED